MYHIKFGNLEEPSHGIVLSYSRNPLSIHDIVTENKPLSTFSTK